MLGKTLFRTKGNTDSERDVITIITELISPLKLVVILEIKRHCYVISRSVNVYMLLLRHRKTLRKDFT